MRNLVRMINSMLICLTIFSCSNDDDNNGNTTNCDQEVLISNDQFYQAPDHQLYINSLEIEDDCLQINFSASGCSGDSWEIKLIDSGDVLESAPPQRNLRLSLDNKEACLAVITKEVSFDIQNLQVDGEQVLLNIINSDDQILYEY